MKQTLTLALALTLSSATLTAALEDPPSGTNLGSVTGGDFSKANILITNKCTSCHSDQRIIEAMAAGKNMQMIQRRMELKGLKLTTDEKKVLGVFWEQTPLKKK